LGLRSLRRWAWVSAIVLSLALLGVLVFEMLTWEVTFLDCVVVYAYASVLGCLCMADIRKLYRGTRPSA
jgi:hypothetical protein